METVITVGDVHGGFEELKKLLAACGWKPGSGRVILLGDLIDRGPYPHQVVEFARTTPGVDAILGNHEDTHLRHRAKGTPNEKRLPDHLRTVEQLTPEDWAYIEQLPTSIVLEDGTICVHAGIVPGVSLARQARNNLLRIQMILPPENRHAYIKPDCDTWWPGKGPAEARFWADLYEGPELIVFGHTGLAAPYVSEFAIGIDTGVAYGGSLTACILPERKIVSVPAEREYRTPRALNFPIGSTFTSGVHKKER
jgi:diadenosine tetraphosphatase ApaH/serine/threonine PP2A family protein phosphatase